jgi:hypothetical protein
VTWLLKTHSYAELVELQVLDKVRAEELQKSEGSGQKIDKKWPDWKELKTKMHVLWHGKKIKMRRPVKAGKK